MSFRETAKFVLLGAVVAGAGGFLFWLAGPTNGPLLTSWLTVGVAAWLTLHRVRLPQALSGTPAAVNFSAPVLLVAARLGGSDLALPAGAAMGVLYALTRALAPRARTSWQARLLGYESPGEAHRASQQPFVYAENLSSPLFSAAVAVWIWRGLADLGLAGGAAPAAWLGWLAAALFLEGAEVLRSAPWLALLGQVPLWPRGATWRGVVVPGMALDAAFGILVQALWSTWGTWGLFGAGALAIGGVAWSSAQVRAVAAAAALRAAEITARTDPLTGLPNRRGLRESARDLSAEGLPMVVAIADADQFKRVNDTWGHECGDAVLQAIAQRLAAACRTQRAAWPDRVGRWGGEEFVLLLPRLSREAARGRLEAVRSAVGREPVAYGRLAIRVTLSMGATVVEQVPWSLDAAVALADQALYRAKAAGRDRLAWWPDPDGTPGPNAPPDPAAPHP